jgi:hypothetical protein
MPLVHLVDRIWHAVLHRLDRVQIGDHRIEIMIGHDLVETARHDHGDRYAIALDAFTQDLLELGIGVVADSGFLVLRDIGRRHFERRLVPAPTAGKCAPGNIGVAARALWRMAIAAGENAIDQIIAALDQISVCPRNVEMWRQTR